MRLVCGLGIGVLGSAFSFVAILLACFITDMCNNGCEGCTVRKTCFAKREIKCLHSDYMSEWMLISFLKVRKHCHYFQRCNLSQMIICFVTCFSCFYFLFWSKGMGLQGLIYGVTAMSLLFLSIVDWKTQYIPFECTVVILICGLIRLFVDFSNWVEYVIGLLAVSGFLVLVNCIFTPFVKRRYANEEGVEVDRAIGDGDIKLMAATGLLLGWKLNLLALAAGCVIGSIIHVLLMVVKKGERQFAFGPYLALGVYITMLCGEQLISWYLNLMGVMPL